MTAFSPPCTMSLPPVSFLMYLSLSFIAVTSPRFLVTSGGLLTLHIVPLQVRTDGKYGGSRLVLGDMGRGRVTAQDWFSFWRDEHIL